jgi:Type IV secretion system pilin
MNNTIGKITGTVNNEAVAKIQDNVLTEIVSPLLGLATAIAFVLFLYGVVKFLIARANNDSAKFEAGKKHLFLGLIALFILVSIWTILGQIANITSSNIWFR